MRLLILALLLRGVCLGQGLSGPVGVVNGPDGELYIAEAGRSRVVTLKGRVLADGVDAWGLVRIGNEIACSEPSRGRLLWLGPEGASQMVAGLSQPTGMWWNADTRVLYVVERGGRLLEVDPFAGTIERTVADDLTGAEGICCTSTEAFVTLPASNRVVRVDLTDGTTTVVTDDIELPTGIAFGRDGLYIASADTGAVTELDPERPEQHRVLVETGAPGVGGLLSVNELDVQALVPGLYVGPFVLGVPASGVADPSTGQVSFAAKRAVVMTNLVDGSVTAARVNARPRRLLDPSLTPAGSLRYELESRLFSCGLTEAELSPGGEVVHAPLLKAIYGAGEPVLGVVDSALDAEGNVYYSFSQGGRILSGWGGSIRVLAEGLQDPAGLAVSNEGAVYVCEAGAGRVSTLLGGGEVLPIGTDLGRPVDLAILPTGIAVVDEEGGRLFLLESDGARLLRDDLKQPVAVTRLPDGDLAVVEAGADRVVRLAPDGATRNVLFTSGRGELVPPRMGWRVLGGLAADPLSGLLYVSLPGRNRWTSVSFEGDEKP